MPHQIVAVIGEYERAKAIILASLRRVRVAAETLDSPTKHRVSTRAELEGVLAHSVAILIRKDDDVRALRQSGFRVLVVRLAPLASRVESSPVVELPLAADLEIEDPGPNADLEYAIRRLAGFLNTLV